jgi:fatty-acyl-CoA synthase
MTIPASPTPLTMSYFAGPREPAVVDMTIGDALRASAERAPSQLALFGTKDPRRWSFAELLADCEAGARALTERFSPGDRIAIWGQNLPEWVLAEYSIALAGLVIVTVNPNLTAEEAAYIFAQSGSTAVLASRSYRGRDLSAICTELQSRLPHLREVIPLDSFVDLIEQGRHLTATLPTLDPGDLVMIQYTSGTTGFPKGAALHHRGLVTNGLHTAMRNKVGAGDTMLGVMPLFHTGGSVLAVLAAGSAGAALALVEEFEPGHLLEAIETHQINTLAAVPTMFIALLEHPNFGSADLSSVRCMTSGGSTVPAPLVERFESAIGAPFTIVFGQTEMSPVATMTYPDDSIADKATTLGLPMPHMEVKIVDAEGNTVPIGEAGEFCARGYLVMREYYDNPEATAEAIDADGWMHSGDLCTMDERGYCRIVGRLKDMIIRGGENIYPREVEDVLFQHPGVADVAVVGLPDDKWGEIVAAVIRPASPNAADRPSVTALREWVRANLAAHKTPAQWFQVEAFPLTGSGKVQKFRLLEMWKAGELSAWEQNP